MIVIPDLVWQSMLREFARVSAGLERVAYLDGVDLGDVGVVTTLTIPDAMLQPRRYSVSAQAMSEAGKHLRVHRLRRLAQVHTHGDHRTDHSPWDDRLAYSQADGAFSLVLPFHGLRPIHLKQVGVHVRDADGWRRIGTQAVSQHVRLVPSLLSFRR